jgi:Flp pilus assembly protein TadG
MKKFTKTRPTNNSPFAVRSKAKKRRGALAVEMALCLPLLFLFLFGCYEAARANMIVHAAESAAYEACRLGVLPGATEDKIRVGADFVLSSVGVSNFDVVVEPGVITNQTEKVRVTVTVPFKSNTSMPSFFFDDPNFVGSCELTRETL